MAIADYTKPKIYNSSLSTNSSIWLMKSIINVNKKNLITVITIIKRVIIICKTFNLKKLAYLTQLNDLKKI